MHFLTTFVTLMCVLSIPPCDAQFDINSIVSVLQTMTIQQKAGFLIDYLNNPVIYDRLEHIIFEAHSLFYEESTLRPEITAHLVPWTIDELPNLLQNQTFKNCFHIFAEEINKANISIVNRTSEFTVISGIFSQMDWLDVIDKIAADIFQHWMVIQGSDNIVAKKIVTAVFAEIQRTIRTYILPVLPGILAEISKINPDSQSPLTTYESVTPKHTSPKTIKPQPSSIITELQNAKDFNEKQLLIYNYLVNNNEIFDKLERLLISVIPLFTEQPTIRDDIQSIFFLWTLGTLPNFLSSKMFKNSFNFFVTKMNRADLTGLNITNEYQFMAGVFKQIDLGEILERTVFEVATSWSGSGDKCSSYPCQNNGTCTFRGDEYTCHCPVGYGGNDCQLEIEFWFSIFLLQKFLPYTGNVLVINDVTSDKTGFYTCIATNDVGMSQAQIQLDAIKDITRIITPPTAAVIMTGHSHNFTCIATRHPPPSIEWTFETFIHHSTTMPPHQLYHQGKILTLHAIKAQESGTLTCTARNDIGDEQVSVPVIFNMPSGSSAGFG
ncbi:HSPG2 [Mytilus coruscus]|uniref:HSPG2 n=1 Tax=Mytilus coruscus TaxID=42192 RepID=A0A6J8AB08_MYTCO|nr:HSPG2 [Mytilus coruscus]